MNWLAPVTTTTEPVLGQMPDLRGGSLGWLGLLIVLLIVAGALAPRQVRHTRQWWARRQLAQWHAANWLLVEVENKRRRQTVREIDAQQEGIRRETGL